MGIIGIRLLAMASLVLPLCGCAGLFGGSPWRGADYSVSPEAYRGQVEPQRIRAEAEMQAIGYKPRHQIAKVEFIPGTVKRPAGWSVPSAESPTGYAGGWTESKRIVVVADPHTGAVIAGDIRHEWKEAILNANFFAGKYNARHAEIAKSEVGK